MRFLCYDVDAERSRELYLPTGGKKWRSCRRSESDSGSYSGPRSLRAGVLFHVKQTKAGRWGNAVAAKICRKATLRQKKFEQKELKGNAVSGNHQNIQISTPQKWIKSKNVAVHWEDSITQVPKADIRSGVGDVRRR